MLMQPFIAYHHLLLQAFNTRMQQPAARGATFATRGAGVATLRWAAASRKEREARKRQRNKDRDRRRRRSRHRYKNNDKGRDNPNDKDRA